MKNIKTYLIPIGAILIVILLVPTIIIPQTKSMLADYKVVSQDQKVLDRLQSKADKLVELAKNPSELETNLTVAESALPIEKDVARLVRGIQALAQSGGLVVTSVKIVPGKTATSSASTKDKTTTATNKSELLVELGLTGNSQNLQTFLKSIESSKRLLVMSTTKGTGTNGNFNYTVIIAAPFGPLPTIGDDQLTKDLPELSAADKKLLEDLKGSMFNTETNQTVPTGPTGVTDPFK